MNHQIAMELLGGLIGLGILAVFWTVLALRVGRPRFRRASRQPEVQRDDRPLELFVQRHLRDRAVHHLGGDR